MTTEDQLERLFFVAEWTPDEIERFLKTCAHKKLDTPDQILKYAQNVLDNQCLSVLRGGDPFLDAMVAEAFGRREQSTSDPFRATHSVSAATACRAPD